MPQIKYPSQIDFTAATVNNVKFDVLMTTAMNNPIQPNASFCFLAK